MIRRLRAQTVTEEELIGKGHRRSESLLLFCDPLTRDRRADDVAPLAYVLGSEQPPSDLGRLLGCNCCASGDSYGLFFSAAARGLLFTGLFSLFNPERVCFPL